MIAQRTHLMRLGLGLGAFLVLSLSERERPEEALLFLARLIDGRCSGRRGDRGLNLDTTKPKKSIKKSANQHDAASSVMQITRHGTEVTALVEASEERWPIDFESLYRRGCCYIRRLELWRCLKRRLHVRVGPAFTVPSPRLA